MEFHVEQTVNPCTSSINDQNEKLSLDIVKAENEKVFKQMVNDEWNLKITDELYTECDQLIEEKINLIKNLKTENEHITQEMRNKSQIQIQLDEEKEHIEQNVIKYKEHFNQLKNIQQFCKQTDLDLKKKISEIQDGINSHKQNERENTEKYTDRINSSMQLFASENNRYVKALNKIEVHFEKIDEQLVDLKDQEQKLQENRRELENQKELYKQENKTVQGEIDEIVVKFTELKEQYGECIEKHESEKREQDIRIAELKTNKEKDNERILVLKAEHERLLETVNSQNLQIAEAEKQQSRLESAMIDGKELAVSLQNELQYYETKLKQQREDKGKEISSKLDYVEKLKQNCKELYDKNSVLKQKCVDGEDMTATLKNNIKDTIEKKANAESNLVNTRQKLEESEQSYREIINEYTKKSDELRIENEDLLNIRETLHREIERKEQEYNEYRNGMEPILNQYRESEASAEKTLADWTLKRDELKKKIDRSNDELKNMELEAQKKCKLMEDEADEKIEQLARDNEQFKAETNELAKSKQGKYLAEIKALHEARQSRHSEMSELKSVKTILQAEISAYMAEITRLSTEIEQIERGNKETRVGRSRGIQVSGIEKLIPSGIPELPTFTPKDTVNLLTESSDDTVKYRPIIDMESEWQKILNTPTSSKQQPPVRPKLTLNKPAVKYDMSWKDSDSGVSDSSKDQSDELFVPVRSRSPMFKKPPIRRPTRASQKSKSRKPVY